MSALSGGETNISVSFGFGDYNFDTNDFGYLGEKDNTFGDNFGFGLGAMANISDIITLGDKITATKNAASNGLSKFDNVEEVLEAHNEIRNKGFINKTFFKNDDFAGSSLKNVDPSILKKGIGEKLSELDGGSPNNIFDGYQHDVAYYDNGANGVSGVFFNTTVTKADISFIRGLTTLVRNGSSVSRLTTFFTRNTFRLAVGLKSIYPFAYDHNPFDE